MTSVSNINATIPASSPVAATSAVPSAVPQDAAPATSAATNTSSTSSNSSAPAVLNSRLVSDPLARVLITQYLDSSNNVVSQNPVSAVVAYLQNGLTADGFSKESASA